MTSRHTHRILWSEGGPNPKCFTAAKQSYTRQFTALNKQLQRFEASYSGVHIRRFHKSTKAIPTEAPIACLFLKPFCLVPAAAFALPVAPTSGLESTVATFYRKPKLQTRAGKSWRLLHPLSSLVPMAGAHVGQSRAAGLMGASVQLPAASLRAPQRHSARDHGMRQAKLPSRRQACGLQCSRRGRDRIADRRLAAALVCAAGSAALDAGAGWSSADGDADAAAASAVQEARPTQDTLCCSGAGAAIAWFQEPKSCTTATHA